MAIGTYAELKTAVANYLHRADLTTVIPDFIARQKGLEEVEYPHPLLERIAKETYGILVYQEQVMQIAQVLSGYSLGEADLLRRAMGKKIKAEMDAQRASFVEGAQKNLYQCSFPFTAGPADIQATLAACVKRAPITT